MELKRCPFCGGEAEANSGFSCVYRRISGFVECKRCGIKVHGKKTFNTYMIETEVSDVAKWAKNAHEEAKQSAIEEWNRRYGDGMDKR